jgi:hypothetical protein
MMTNFAMRCLLAVVACAMAGSVVAAQSSYTNMLNTIQMQNQSWNSQLNSYNRQFGSAARSASPSVPLPAAQPGAAAGALQPGPALPQYPATATDFNPVPVRLVPERLADGLAGLTSEQKQTMRAMYSEFLDDFEKVNRKNNLAAALAYVVRASLRSVYDKDLTQAELNQMAWNFNSVLATNPAFNAMPPQEKQVLYENLIITGGTIVFLQAKAVQEDSLSTQRQAKELGQAVLKQWLNL